ncbi:hypothetical protein [Streptomyces sp. NPDC046261]|uniref:hypothetical protein n=1 Tax=Streptomyces sp. NPDC046261 TaxID=3157200 RepID=UPI0033CB9199
MLTHTKAGTWRRSALAVGTVAVALALTACNSSAGSGAGEKKSKAKASAEADKPLKIGQPSPEPMEIGRYGKTGKFTITPQRVVMGKPSDLTELDAQKYQGMTVAWAYVNAKLVGGDMPMKGPMVSTNVGVLSEGNQRGTQLILIGDMPGRPADCRDLDTDATWQKDEEHTACMPFIVPEKQKVTAITYSRGYYKAPLKWTLE